LSLATTPPTPPPKDIAGMVLPASHKTPRITAFICARDQTAGASST
jgi:hypothetical protein